MLGYGLEPFNVSSKSSRDPFPAVSGVGTLLVRSSLDVCKQIHNNFYYGEKLKQVLYIHT